MKKKGENVWIDDGSKVRWIDVLGWGDEGRTLHLLKIYNSFFFSFVHHILTAILCYLKALSSV